jgi:hypothetical protein
VCAAMLGVGVPGTAVLHARAAHSTAHSFVPLCLHSVASVHAPLIAPHRVASWSTVTQLQHRIESCPSVHTASQRHAVPNPKPPPCHVTMCSRV